MPAKNPKMTLDRLALAIKSDFVNLEKKFLNKIDNVEEKILYKIDSEISGVKHEIKDFKHKMSGDLENIYSQLSNLEKESKLGFAQYKRHDDQLANHEHRLVKLESS